jgi:hypothetical protein
MDAAVTIDAAADDSALRHDQDRRGCRTCMRRRALRTPGVVPRVDAIREQRREDGYV